MISGRPVWARDTRSAAWTISEPLRPKRTSSADLTQAQSLSASSSSRECCPAKSWPSASVRVTSARHSRRRVAEDGGTHAERVVDVDVAVHVRQVRALAPGEADGRASQPNVAVHAPGDTRFSQAHDSAGLRCGRERRALCWSVLVIPSPLRWSWAAWASNALANVVFRPWQQYLTQWNDRIKLRKHRVSVASTPWRTGHGRPRGWPNAACWIAAISLLIHAVFRICERRAASLARTVSVFAFTTFCSTMKCDDRSTLWNDYPIQDKKQGGTMKSTGLLCASRAQSASLCGPLSRTSGAMRPAMPIHRRCCRK